VKQVRPPAGNPPAPFRVSAVTRPPR